MIQYERHDVSEATYLKKSNESKEYMLCHYWYFKDIDYKYEEYLIVRQFGQFGQFG